MRFGALGLVGGAEGLTGEGAGLSAVGFTGWDAAAAGLLTSSGLGTGGWLVVGGLCCKGFGLLAETGAPGAFLTERMDFPGAGLAGGATAGFWELLPSPRSLRIFPASASLIELLWLFAAIESFSAASSTSLFSRPRSLDSS